MTLLQIWSSVSGPRFAVETGVIVMAPVVRHFPTKSLVQFMTLTLISSTIHFRVGNPPLVTVLKLRNISVLPTLPTLFLILIGFRFISRTFNNPSRGPSKSIVLTLG